MGVQLLDYLQFEDLVPLCEEAKRWSFLCVVAPLRLPAATGSPINPIAIKTLAGWNHGVIFFLLATSRAVAGDL